MLIFFLSMIAWGPAMGNGEKEGAKTSYSSSRSRILSRYTIFSGKGKENLEKALAIYDSSNGKENLKRALAMYDSSDRKSNPERVFVKYTLLHYEVFSGDGKENLRTALAMRDSSDRRSNPERVFVEYKGKIPEEITDKSVQKKKPAESSLNDL